MLEFLLCVTFLKTDHIKIILILYNYLYLICYLPFKPFTTQSCLLMTLKMKPFKNILENEENAGNQHLLLFPQ